MQGTDTNEKRIGNERTRAKRPMDKKAEKIILGYIALGLSQREACFLAGGINPSVWNKYKKSHEITPEFIEMIQNRPSMKAKMVVAKDIEEGNTQSAKWWLEHKNADEFNTKVVQDVTVAPVLSMEDKQSELQKYMQKFIDRDNDDGESRRFIEHKDSGGGSEAMDEGEDPETL